MKTQTILTGLQAYELLAILANYSRAVGGTKVSG